MLSQVAAENERRARKLEAQEERQQVDHTRQERTIAPPPVKYCSMKAIKKEAEKLPLTHPVRQLILQQPDTLPETELATKAMEWAVLLNTKDTLVVD